MAATILVTGGLLMLSANVALANVGLPYTFHITYISGYWNGVQTPPFATNSTRQICIKPNLYVSQDANAGPPTTTIGTTSA